MDAATRHDILMSISDVSKDAYGYRVRLDYNSMSDAELQNVWDSTLRAAQRSVDEENERIERAEAELKVRLQSYITMGAETLKDAIRWDMESVKADNDTDYYAYLIGARYSVVLELIKEAA